MRDNPVSSSRRTSPNGTNIRNAASNGQQPGIQQNMNYTSQWSAEPTTSETQNVIDQQTVVQVQSTNRNSIVDNTSTADRQIAGCVQMEGEVGQIHQTPVHNDEISSYQPQYQEGRT